MEARSLGDMLRRSAQTWPERTAMLCPKGAEFEPLTYAQFYDTVHRYASALTQKGLRKGDPVAILSESGPEWAFLDWAGQTLGLAVVPIFPTLPPDQVLYILENSHAKVVFCGGDELLQKTEGTPAERVLISEFTTQAQAAPLLDRAAWEAGIDAVAPDDLATIIYTSGTTGNPKGAMLPHRAFCFLADSALASIPIGPGDVFLSFLPMSHVYERFAGQALVVNTGATVAYARSLMTLAGDMLKVRPTVMLCVPRFLEATKDKIEDGVRKAPPLRQKLFRLALAQGVRKSRGQFAPLYGLTDRLVGAKIRERLGGRMRMLVSGGAALPPTVADFYQAFGLTVLQGYGLTETTAATCVNHPDRNKPSTVGEPIPGIEVRLAEDGEILVRGPSRMLGYFEMPEATAEAIDADGWFHTGDIGEFEGKHLKITDRKKDILVLGNGKNVAPQPIENKLKESPYIQEAVLIGDGLDWVCALIVPQFAALPGGAELPPETLVESAETKALLKKEISRVNQSLAGFEKIKKHALLPQNFSVETGELTPTLKVKRRVVKEKYAAQIAEMTGKTD